MNTLGIEIASRALFAAQQTPQRLEFSLAAEATVGEGGVLLVGARTAELAAMHGTPVVSDLLPLLESRFDDATTRIYARHAPFDIVKKGDGIQVRLVGHLFSPEDIVTSQLSQVLATATGDNTVEQVVLALPAATRSSTRQWFVRALNDAGARQARLIDRGVALTFALEQQGLCLNIIAERDSAEAVVTRVDGASRAVRTTCASQDASGMSFEQESMLGIIWTKALKHSPLNRPDATVLSQFGAEGLHEVFAQLERLREDLARETEAQIDLSVLGEGFQQVAVTRREVEDYARGSLEAFETLCRRVAREHEEFDHINIVGEFATLPAFREAAEKVFGRAPHVIEERGAVALGAATFAKELAGGTGDAVLLERVPFTVGLSSAQEISDLVQAQQRRPFAVSRTLSTTVDDQNTMSFLLMEGTPLIDRDPLEHVFDVTIETSPRMSQFVDLRLGIDTSGVLHVDAVDLATGKSLPTSKGDSLREDSLVVIQGASR